MSLVPCAQVSKDIACFQATDLSVAPVQVFAHSVYDSSGALSALYYTDAAGIIVNPAVYLGGGVVTPGLCVTPVVRERQVCIDTGTEIVEAWLVIGRDPFTLEPVVKRYEALDGGEVTGTVVPCDCSTTVITPLLEARNTYTGSGIQSYYVDKWNADCGPVTWTVEAFKDGALVYTSPTSPVLTSATAAQSWLNTSGGGGYVTLNSFNDQVNGNPAVNSWSLPSQSDGEWLIVITENAGNQCAPICYGFANYDIQNNQNGSPTGWWDTIGSVGLNPVTGPSNYPWQIG